MKGTDPSFYFFLTNHVRFPFNPYAWSNKVFVGHLIGDEYNGKVSSFLRLGGFFCDLFSPANVRIERARKLPCFIKFPLTLFNFFSACNASFLTDRGSYRIRSLLFHPVVLESAVGIRRTSE